MWCKIPLLWDEVAWGRCIQQKVLPRTAKANLWLLFTTEKSVGRGTVPVKIIRLNFLWLHRLKRKHSDSLVCEVCDKIIDCCVGMKIAVRNLTHRHCYAHEECAVRKNWVWSWSTVHIIQRKCWGWWHIARHWMRTSIRIIYGSRILGTARHVTNFMR